MKKISRENLPHLTWRLFLLLRKHIDNFIVRILAIWWKVFIGKNCLFRGIPIIRRHPNSSIKVGENCTFHSSRSANQGGIARPCILWTLAKDAQISIGKGSGFSGTVINAEIGVFIGENVRCGTNTQIMDSDMHTEDKRVSSAQSVTIGDGVWLGMNAVVLKGVTIGEGTLVGANSLVTQSMPPHSIVAGNPARVIRNLEV